MQLRKLPLYVVIKSDGGKDIAEIVERLLTLADYEPHHGEEPVEQIEALAELMSGLSEKEFIEISTPDFNSVCEWVSDQLYYPEKLRAEFKSGNDFVDLLQSFTSEDGAEVKKINIKVPSLKALRLRDKQGDSDLIKAIWMTSYCTGISPGDLRKVSLPDWMVLQGKIGSFLSKTTATFRSGTSKQ